ncbi:MAG TPA: AfsR/SARP family transcriptional regulator [Candidatus Limnocylindrales bacterium]|nr:AfsR/SARP family transcriptional regulator [Candidatus Limnocylindrales bacterium]
MQFRLFGPIEMWDDGRRVDLGHAKQQGVLVALLMDTGHVVPTQVLMDRVWGHDPPNTALNVLYGYIARLRKVLAPAGVRLDRRSGGYCLDVKPEAVDVHRFRCLVAAAEKFGDTIVRASKLNEALALWRGPPFASTDSPWIAAVREALQGELLSVVIARNHAYLCHGWHAELVSPLLEMVATHPSDERPVAQLMIALYRSGRMSEALEQYQRARQRLADELGTEPSPYLRLLQQQVLRGDPLLHESSATPRRPMPDLVGVPATTLAGGVSAIGPASIQLRAIDATRGGRGYGRAEAVPDNGV